MIPVKISCPTCCGSGYIHPPPPPHAWLRCSMCDGTGRSWSPGAPSFGCETTLGDVTPGSTVTLGTGDRCRVLWHMPRIRVVKKRRIAPETTFVGEIEDFTDIERHQPISFPSVVGVLSIDGDHVRGDDDAHAGEKDLDFNDPVHRQVAGRLL